MICVESKVTRRSRKALSRGWDDSGGW